MRIIAFLSLFLLFLTGCSEAFHPFPPESSSGQSSATGERPTQLAPGYTPCNDYPNPTYGVICHPNQYCGNQSFGRCYTGCLSEDNCTENQACVKNGRSIGTCISNDELEGRAEGQELDEGYTACGNPGTTRYSVCHPGQYCSSSYWGDCSLGCLSERNCTENQYCEKQSGAHVGICTADR